MSKQTDLITAYKKVNPELYRLYHSCIDEDTPEEAIEDTWYWYYAVFTLPDLVKQPFPFLLTDRGVEGDPEVIKAVGRLLLKSWYYHVEDWGKEICMYIFMAYSKGQPLKRADLQEVINHITEQIVHFKENRAGAKLYILERFFQIEAEPILVDPTPTLQRYEEAKGLLKRMQRTPKAIHSSLLITKQRGIKPTVNIVNRINKVI